MVSQSTAAERKARKKAAENGASARPTEEPCIANETAAAKKLVGRSPAATQDFQGPSLAKPFRSHE